MAAVHIVRNGDTYVVKWLTPRGLVNVGVGFVSGNKLSVGYVGATAGVVVYNIDGAQLTGEWADIAASGHVYKETLRSWPMAKRSSHREAGRSSDSASS